MFHSFHYLIQNLECGGICDHQINFLQFSSSSSSFDGFSILSQYPTSITEFSPRFLCRSTAFFFLDLLEPWDVRELYIRKTADLPMQLCLCTFPRFVAIGFPFLPKPLYKSLHQSFFYSFITVLPSESGVTLHYSTILPQTIISTC